MLRFCTSFFFFAIIISLIAGCKLDKPIYPSTNDTTTVKGTGTTGTGTGTTGTGTTGTGTTGTGTGSTGNTPALVDNGSNITYTINGNTTVLNEVAFQVTQPDTTTHPFGSTLIVGGVDISGGFSLAFSGMKPGNYGIDLLFLGNYTGSGGKVSVTTLTTTDGVHGTVIGTFTTNLTDITTSSIVSGVTGTFNIKI
jgi:hypothetical protein